MMPRTSVIVNITRATIPVPRPRAHSASFMPLLPPVPRASRCAGGPRRRGPRGGPAAAGRRSQARPATPLTMVAVAAALALAQERGRDADAAPDRVGRTAGAPGRRCGAASRCPRRQVRRTVLEVASAAPDGSETWAAGSESVSWTRTCHPSAGAGPAVAMSPPRLTSTPTPSRLGDQGGGAVGGHRLGGGAQVELRCPRAAGAGGRRAGRSASRAPAAPAPTSPEPLSTRRMSRS